MGGGGGGGGGGGARERERDGGTSHACIVRCMSKFVTVDLLPPTPLPSPPPVSSTHTPSGVMPSLYGSTVAIIGYASALPFLSIALLSIVFV